MAKTEHLQSEIVSLPKKGICDNYIRNWKECAIASQKPWCMNSCCSTIYIRRAMDLSMKDLLLFHHRISVKQPP